jgi:2-keto-3-deoxy-L-rhamnonate aldolase RhmA
MSYKPHNPVKEKLARGEASFGIFLLSGSSIIAEACSTLPIDWIIVDMEASYISKQEVLHLFQALKGTTVSPMLRIRDIDKHYIEFSLDVGAHGVLVPKIETADQASLIAQWMYYPPRGNRGINPVRVTHYFEYVPDYLATANQHLLAMVQIESAEAVKRCDSIAAVDGIDLLFIGCGDLASSYGQAGTVEGPLMDQARRAVLTACRKYHKIPGIFAYSIDLAIQYREEGFTFIAIGNDIKLLKEELRRSLNTLSNRDLSGFPSD